MSLTCHEEIGLVGRVCEDVTRMPQEYNEETAPVKFQLYEGHALRKPT